MTPRTLEQTRDDAIYLRDEAARILDSDVFMSAVRLVKESAMRDLLAAKGPDADTIRRECADRINAVDAVISQVEAQFAAATAALKPRGQVA